MDLKDLYVKVECPYNPSHMICPLRMPYHLHRCRKNYPNLVMSVCPYNAMHEVRTPELKYHMSQCPNRTLLERDMPYNALQNALLGKEEKEVKGNTDLPHPARIPRGDDDNLENWDQDVSPFVFRPQETARALRRNPERRQIDSHLRIPQGQSIAASLASSQPGGCLERGENRNDNGNNSNNNKSNNDNNNSTSDEEEGSHRPQENQGRAPIPASSSLSSSSSSLSTENRKVDMTTNSQLALQMSGCQRSFPAGSHLLAFGRGRARPALMSPVTAQSSKPLLDTPPLLPTPAFIRMGRGGGGVGRGRGLLIRPTFRS